MLKNPNQLIQEVVSGKDAGESVVDSIKLLGEFEQPKCEELARKDPEAGSLASRIFNDYTHQDLSEATTEDLMGRYRWYLTKEQVNKAKKAALDDLREVQDTGNVAMGDMEWKGYASEPIQEKMEVKKKSIHDKDRYVIQSGDSYWTGTKWDSNIDHAKYYINKKDADKFVSSTQQESITPEDLINQVLENNGELDEGWFDRLKAKGAGAVGAVKGAGKVLGGMGKGGIAGMKGDIAGVKKAQKDIKAGEGMGLDAKSKSVIKSHVKKLQKRIDDFTNDIKKLKIETPEINKLHDTLINLDRQLMQMVSGKQQGNFTTPAMAFESLSTDRMIDKVMEGIDPVHFITKPLTEESDFDEKYEVVEYTLPAYWASYLINGDASGLEDNEQEEIDSWMEGENNPWFVDVGESFFSHYNDVNNMGGDVAEYTAHIEKQ